MEFNPQKQLAGLLEWMDQQMTLCHGKTAVIGISGGKDSSTVAALAVAAYGRENVYGVLMPNGVQPDIDYSQALVEHLNIPHCTINIHDAVQGVLHEMEQAGLEPSRQTRAILPSPIRLAPLYAVAQTVPDGIVINKCDGNNVDKCQLAATQFRNALHLFPAPESGWTPQVLTYSGFYNLGVKEIWDMVYSYMDFVKGNGYFEHRRNEQSKYWMYETINEQLRNSFFQNEQIVSRLAEAEAMVLSGRQTSFVAAKQLLDEYFASLR